MSFGQMTASRTMPFTPAEETTDMSVLQCFPISPCLALVSSPKPIYLLALLHTPTYVHLWRLRVPLHIIYCTLPDDSDL
jgi:hypothetical protein